MRRTALAAMVSGVIALSAPDGVWSKAAAPIVVLELFTSEGCSSCPPADTLLSRLTDQSPDGATILTLSEHVDYWDQLGWRDPYSSASFSRRQSDYAARAFRSGDIYTPQIVVDGRLQAVGSDAAAVRSLLTQAARDPKAAVAVTAARAETSGEVVANVEIDATAGPARRGDADVVVAIVEHHLKNDVTRGENKGRTLEHSAVVRVLTSAGTLAVRAMTFTGNVRMPWHPAWKAGDVRVIAFVQDKKTMRIFGGGSTLVH